MSILDDKRDIFTTIGAYTSLNDGTISIKNVGNSISSITNKDDITGYLLDILKVTVGTDALKNLIGEFFTNFINGVEPKMKLILKKQLTQFNSGDNIPDFLKSGVSIPIKNIDLYGKLKVNPTTIAGSLLHNLDTPNFDKSLHDSILNNGTDITYNNLKLNYNNDVDSITLKANTVGNVKIGTFFNSYIDQTNILNKKELITNIINSIFGTISNDQNKTLDEINLELKFNAIIDKLINNDENYNLSSTELDKLFDNSNNLKNGITSFDMGCGLVDIQYSIDDMASLVNQINSSIDPFVVSNAVDNIINTASNAAASDPALNENKETIKDNFFQNLIKQIALALVKAFTVSPEIRALLGISSALTNNGISTLTNTIDNLKDYNIFLKCMISELMRLIIEFIFNLVVLYLTKLMKPVITKISKEVIENYKTIILSLTHI